MENKHLSQKAQNAAKRMLDAAQTMYLTHLEGKTFSPLPIASKAGTDMSLGSYLVRKGMIKKVKKGVYTWIAGEPTYELMEVILLENRQIREGSTVEGLDLSCGGAQLQIYGEVEATGYGKPICTPQFDDIRLAFVAQRYGVTSVEQFAQFKQDILAAVV